MCLSAIFGGATALLGASAAGDATDAQVAAAQQQLALQQQIYEENVDRFDPYYQSGVFANQAYNSLLGLAPAPMIGGSAAPITTEVVGGGGGVQGNAMLGGASSPPVLQDFNAMQADTPGTRPMYGVGPYQQQEAYSPQQPRPPVSGGAGQTLYRVGDQTFATLEEAQAYANANPVGGTQYGGFQASPGYQFALQSGLDAIDASASAGGNLYSGATMQAAQEYGTGLANQEFDKYLAQVGGVSAAGQAAAGQQAQAGTNYATGASNAYANMGNAQAAGAIGVNNALMNGLNTGIGLYQYQQGLNTQPKSGLGLF